MSIRHLVLVLIEKVTRELSLYLAGKLCKCTADKLGALMQDEEIPMHIRQAVARDVLAKYSRVGLASCDAPRPRMWN